jgi:polyisoprenoid-binding protein YceI/mono/diheme cytochrome c family protein
MTTIWKRRLLMVFALILFCLFAVPVLFSLLSSRHANHEHPQVEKLAFAPASPILAVTTAQQTLYRLDPTQSTASYRVREVILNTLQGREVMGSTTDIQGEILLDNATPSNSQLGEIIIGLQNLQSDSDLRDQRLRADYLQSDTYPHTRFVAQDLLNLPTSITQGETYSFQIDGYLTVKETTAKAVWDVTLTLDGTALRGTATTQILMSTYEVGPINLIGWLQTEDAMQLSLSFVALSQDVPAIALVVSPTPNANNPNVTNIDDAPSMDFATVRPILEANCVGCHTMGQIGYSIFAMSTVGEVTAFAQDIAQVVQGGYMPPWHPSNAMPAIQHDRSLTADEIADIVAWAKNPQPVGDNADEPLVVISKNKVTIRQDLVLPMPVEYQSPEGRTDDYRCFLLDPQLDSPRYITASEVIPGNFSVVHHVLVFPVPAEARATAEAKSNQDGRAGWECFGGTGLTNVATNTAIAPGWVPGASANKFPPNTGILLQAGDLLVFQAHYNLEAGNAPDRSTLILELSDPNPNMIALQGIGLVAPVEIPCPRAYQDTLPCQRDHSIAHAETLDPEAGFFADGLLVWCNRTLDDYLVQNPAQVQSSCDSQAPIGGQAIQVTGHMHRLGASIRIELNPDTPTMQVLLDLPYWDFDWQENYNFVTPIPIAQGDTLRIICTWDNTRGIQTSNLPNPQSAHTWRTFLDGATVLAHDELNTHPFQYVTWGEGTRDEMCLAGVIVIPDPEYYGVTLTDGGEGDESTLILAIAWMRLWRDPFWASVVIMGIVTLVVGVGAVLYRRRMRA